MSNHKRRKAAPRVQQSWDRVWPRSEQLEFLDEMCQLHLEACTSSPQSLEIAKLLEARDYLGLCKYDLSYGGDENVVDLIHLRQALALYKKSTLEFPGVTVDRKAAAFGKFVQSELDCRLTNECFRARARGDFQFRPYVERILHTSARKIARVLGDAPEVSDLSYCFGPGATTDVVKRKASPRTKLSAGFQCSPSLLPLLPRLLNEFPGWSDFVTNGTHEGSEQCPAERGEQVKGVPVDVVDGSLGFVPKSSLVDRGIVVEPVLNTLLQGGIGRLMAEKLLTECGLDLRRQEPNQVLARQGSIDGSLATIDLSSASDTVATNLVLDLLPDDWFDLLASARSGSVTFKGRRIVLEKFSSMGNGTTFPLETLLFWSFAVSVAEAEGCEGAVRVYGDDIIVPAACAPQLIGVLRDLGFTPNPSKSFWEGPFRESCGKDYYKGIDIRPAYLDEVGYPQLFSLYNFYKGKLLDEFADRVLSWIPEAIRIWGPTGYGDGHLHTQVWGRAAHRDRGYAGFLFETYSFLGARETRVLPGDALLPAYTIYARNRGKSWSEWLPLPTSNGLVRRRSHHMAALSARDLESYAAEQTFRIRKDTGDLETQWRTVVSGRSRHKQTGLSYKVTTIYTLTTPG